MNEDKRQYRKKIMRRFWRAWLNSFPFFPGRELFDLVDALDKNQSDFDVQVEDAIESLRKTTSLVNELENGLKDRTKRLTSLQAEHKKYSGLAKHRVREC